MPALPKTHRSDIKRLYDTRYQVLHRDTFYQSAPWVKLRNAYRSANALCEICKSNGEVVPAYHIHHIITRDIDRTKELLWQNLQSLCHSCHSKLHSEGIWGEKL